MAEKPKLIPILVPDEEAKLFLLFQERFDLYEAMRDAGVLDLKWGKATMNFAKGAVQSITVEAVAWRRPG